MSGILCHRHDRWLAGCANVLLQLIPQDGLGVHMLERDTTSRTCLLKAILLPGLVQVAIGQGLVILGVVHDDDHVLQAALCERGQQLPHPCDVVLAVKHPVIVLRLFPSFVDVNGLVEELRCRRESDFRGLDGGIHANIRNVSPCSCSRRKGWCGCLERGGLWRGVCQRSGVSGRR